jgi:hypothetical protein
MDFSLERSWVEVGSSLDQLLPFFFSPDFPRMLNKTQSPTHKAIIFLAPNDDHESNVDGE